MPNALTNVARMSGGEMARSPSMNFGNRGQELLGIARSERGVRLEAREITIAELLG